MIIPKGWSSADIQPLHDDLVRELCGPVQDAFDASMTVKLRSGFRSPVKQRGLYVIFRRDLTRAEAIAALKGNLGDAKVIAILKKTLDDPAVGPFLPAADRALLTLARVQTDAAAGLVLKPLAAAPPGKSAHNYQLCTVDAAHVAGAAEVCNVCAGAVKPAAAAVDVLIQDRHGTTISTGGALELKYRPHVWQTWATILKKYPKLRDGGAFSRPDTPHVELTRWDFKTHTVRP